MTWRAPVTNRRWGLGVLLALLALMAGVASPPGFMVAARGRTATLVICTGHGPETIVAGPGAPDHRSGKAGHDGGPCPFAGHGVAVAPPLTGVASGLTLATAPATVATPPDLAPGRGLAAPPPPSHAPPVLV